MINYNAINSFLLTALAMLAFAANSVLCRLALQEDNIDASSFSAIRIISGALILSALVFFKKSKVVSTCNKTVLFFPLALSVYVIFFSYAYIQLEAATGALVLFTTVQITMMLYSLIKGERYNSIQWLAYGLCLAGFFVLLLPSAEQPPILPVLLMVVSGIAWGAYTLLASKAGDPLLSVQQAFLYSVPVVIILIIFVSVYNSDALVLTKKGVLLAILSGAFASGLGYFIWYQVLQKITAFNAALAQLSVPIITAIMGILFLGELLNKQIIAAAILIILGLLINIIQSKFK